MLVCAEHGDRPNHPATAGVSDRSAGRRADGGDQLSASRIIRRHADLSGFEPTLYLYPVIRAYEALLGYLARPAETILGTSAPFQQQVVTSALHAFSAPVVVERRAQVVTPRRAVRRVKAFFIAQKVNGRNAP